MTTDTFYAVADDSIDRSTTEETWAAKHDAASGSTLYQYGSINLLCGLSGYDSLRRYICTFDTSSISDTARITSATLYIRGYSKTNDQAGSWFPTINVVSSTPASNTEIVIGDYDQLGTSALSSAISYSSFSSSGWNSFSLNSTGLDLISKVGYTRLGIREMVYDAANSPPYIFGGNRFEFRFYGNENGTYPIHLEVIYSTQTDYTESLSTQILRSSSFSRKVPPNIHWSMPETKSVIDRASLKKKTNYHRDSKYWRSRW
jgi:hypothetical protein